MVFVFKCQSYYRSRANNACSSTIIDDIWQSCQLDPSSAIAYFYFTDQQQPEDLVRSMIYQFCCASNSVPKPLVTLYEKCQPNGQQPQQPTMGDLLSALRLIFEDLGHVYVVIDA